MRLDVVSLAPEAFAPLLGLGVIGRAFSAGRAELHLHNPRDFATDRYRKVDDEPLRGRGGDGAQARARLRRGGVNPSPAEAAGAVDESPGEAPRAG